MTKVHLCPYGLKQSILEEWNGLPFLQNCYFVHMQALQKTMEAKHLTHPFKIFFNHQNYTKG